MKSTHLHLTLGNQLFSVKDLRKHLQGSFRVFMREDPELCTHFKYHKHKIIFFLSAMRKYAAELKASGIEVHYEMLDERSSVEAKTATKGKGSFDASLKTYVIENKIKSISFFEIEDKFFEKRILELCISLSITPQVLRSPMFLTSREDFKKYLTGTKRPFMKTFYEAQRKRLKVLIEKDGTPVGGQWSFDEENRKPLPKTYEPPVVSKIKMEKIDQAVMTLVEARFPDHPGEVKNFWLPTDRAGAKKWLEKFLSERLADFGPYEDALSEKHDFVNHSVLTPFLNCGLLTPEDVVRSTIEIYRKSKGSRGSELPLNSVEGFIRQVIGWREFIRGIYQNFSEKQDSTNFWKHKRKLTKDWYLGTTGIAPLDHVIKKTVRIGYAHHIERLMVVGSLMLILEIDPVEAHRWFMEMFIDSSDWVMGPNVYGMAIFSDGGIFATKPYFCGSNYYKKMGGYKDGEWQDGVDGLYWGFIEKNRTFFSKNPRMSMMVKTAEKMPADKKKRIYAAAEKLKARITK